MVRNHRKQKEEPGPARVDRLGTPRRERDIGELLRIRNRTESRRDAKRVRAPAKARAKLSQFLRAEDKKRAETAAEVIDPETGRTREDTVEKRVKRRGLSVIKNKIIGGNK